MSRFKGTKGKWEVRPADHIGCTLVYFGDFKGQIECWHHHGDTMTSKESKANALLISKAPEMLEMLERLAVLLEDIESTLFHHNHSIDGWHLNGQLEPIMNFVDGMDIDAISKAKQLIKEATEL